VGGGKVNFQLVGCGCGCWGSRSGVNLLHATHARASSADLVTVADLAAALFQGGEGV